MLTESSLHAALGERGPLDLGMVQRAVDQGIREDECLDWKQDLYSKESGKDEFAKDVAAFANGRGGLLLIGVAEDRATGRASKVHPVTVTDAVERQMRAWLHTRVNPAVPGIRFVPLVDADGEGVLAVVVPESPEMPHMVGADKSCGFPVRVGTQTQWLREYDLERAYRQRFDRRASDEQALSSLIEGAIDHLDLDEGCWVVAAARPTVPASTSLDREDVRQLLEAARNMHADLVPSTTRDANLINSLGDGRLNPRVGLRKWVAAHRGDFKPSAKSDGAYVELHSDGSIVVAGLAGGAHVREQVEGRNTVPEFAVTGVVVDLVNLVVACMRERDASGSVLVRIDLARADGVPYAFLQAERFGAGQPSWSLDVRRFVPVHDVIVPDADIERRRTTATRLIGDVTAQFGVTPSDFGYGW